METCPRCQEEVLEEELRRFVDTGDVAGCVYCIPTPRTVLRDRFG